MSFLEFIDDKVEILNTTVGSASIKICLRDPRENNYGHLIRYKPGVRENEIREQLQVRYENYCRNLRVYGEWHGVMPGTYVAVNWQHKMVFFYVSEERDFTVIEEKDIAKYIDLERDIFCDLM